MKKLFIISIICLLLLGGCSAKNKNAEISAGNDVLVTIGDKKITKSSIYNVMLNNNGMNAILQEVQKEILDKEIETTPEMEEEAKKSLENLSSLYGDNFKDMVKYYGYADEDDFYENGLLFNVRVEHLIAKYVSMNFETLKETYKPKKVNVLIFAGIEDASNAHAAIEKGTSFKEAAETFNATSTYLDHVVTSGNTFFNSNVLAYINGVEEPAYSGTILSSSDSTCFLVEVISTDPAEFEEEAVDAIVNDISSISNDALIHYLKEYNFTIYDKGMYDLFHEKNPDFLVQSK